MPAYEPMSLYLQTERLSMQPWAEPDAGGLRATEAARAVVHAAVATGRARLWSTVRTWNTPSFRVLDKLGFERDHVSPDKGGELVWLTRALP